jgi:hypothetical protein
MLQWVDVRLVNFPQVKVCAREPPLVAESRPEFHSPEIHFNICFSADLFCDKGSQIVKLATAYLVMKSVCVER